MQTADFNLQRTVSVIKSKWRFIIAFVAISLVATSITLLIVPKYYRSFSILVPANPALADKARLFNTNIEGLYSYFGSGDDLDRIFGIASMDTVYKQLVDSFQLVDYYELSGKDKAILRRKAVLELRDDLTFQKTDLGQLKIFAWTKDKQLSANLVNRLVEIVQSTEESIWKENYQNSLKKLQTSIQTMEQEYKNISAGGINASNANSSNNVSEILLLQSKQHNLLEQINSYQKAANEFQLAISNNPPALYIMERAVPAAKSEKPNMWNTILVSFLASLFFGTLVVLVYNRESAF